MSLAKNANAEFDLNKYYPLSVEDKWTYSALIDQNSDEETISVEGEENINGIAAKKISYSGGESYYLFFDSEGVKEIKSSVTGEDEYTLCAPPRLIFPSGIEIGEEKQSAAEINYYGKDNRIINKDTERDIIKLQAVEDVDVPAGHFTDCLEFYLVSDLTLSDGRQVHDECTVWLAPAVGRVKEFCVTDEYDPEREEKIAVTKLYELKSAIINGEKIGNE